MEYQKIIPDHSVSLFVKEIMVFTGGTENNKTILPFYADGYPGLLFHITPKGQWVQPVNKKMPNAYLYGQTIHPIELHMEGSYTMIVFLFFPFVLKSLFDVDPKDLTDTCYDLSRLKEWVNVEKKLMKVKNLQGQILLITEFLYNAFSMKKKGMDLVIKEIIQLILNARAQITVKDLCNKAHLTRRTFERRFKTAIGIPAKDFIQIIRFQQSYEQLQSRSYNKLSDIVYQHGYADQSHFIRVFKAYTGKAPSKFLQK